MLYAFVIIRPGYERNGKGTLLLKQRVCPKLNTSLRKNLLRRPSTKMYSFTISHKLHAFCRDIVITRLTERSSRVFLKHGFCIIWGE